MRDTHSTGNRTEAIVMSHLIGRYETVLIPFGDGRRYDLVVDDGEKFIRIQCKTGWVKQGAIYFNSGSSTYQKGFSAGRHRRTRDYRGEADFFGVYCADTSSVYLVPVEHVGTDRGILRIDPTKNNQSKNVRWARDYVLQAPPAAIAHEEERRPGTTEAPGSSPGGGS